MTTTPTTNDFGNVGIVTRLGHDAFFLDANVVVAFIDTDEIHHQAVNFFLTYLRLKGKRLIVSEVVVRESMYVLGKKIYANMKMEEWLQKQMNDPNSSPSPQQKAEKHRSFKGKWTQKAQVSDEDLRTTYHKVRQELSGFLASCEIVQTSPSMIQDTLLTASETPLHAGDSFIVTAARHSHSAMITLDSDLNKAIDLALYTTKVKNDTFQVEDLKRNLGIEDYLDHRNTVNEILHSLTTLGYYLNSTPYPGYLLASSRDTLDTIQQLIQTGDKNKIREHIIEINTTWSSLY